MDLKSLLKFDHGIHFILQKLSFLPNNPMTYWNYLCFVKKL
ncbi:MAG: hypothetical protein RL491_1111 [Bacteroidota bacterium]